MISKLKNNWTAIAILALVAYILSGNKLNKVVGFLDDKTDVDDKKDDSDSGITNSTAQAIAEQLHVAMKSMGTDEEAIYAAFDRIETIADYNKVYNIFGQRQYSSTFGNVGDPVSSSNKNLIEWIVEELSPEELQTLEMRNPQLQLLG